MNNSKQKTLTDTLKNPYATGMKVRSLVEELSIRGWGDYELRAQISALFRVVALNFSSAEQRLYASGYWHQDRRYAA